MEQTIRNIRLDIDKIATVMQPDLGIGEYFNEARENLLKSKAWLGEVLGLMGTASPYPKDGARKSVADIEPTADHEENVVPVNWHLKNDVEKIDWLRQHIAAIKEAVQTMEGLPQNREIAIARTNSWSYLCEARYSLGYQLGKIRDVSQQ